MKFAPLAALLVLCASSAAAQKVRGGFAPAQQHDVALRAVRFLGELQQGSNRGVRLTGDVDGDGDLDLLMLRRPSLSATPNGVQTWLNQGDASFALAHELSFAWANTSSGDFSLAYYLALADVTGDGVLDLVYERKDIYHRVGPHGVLIHPGLGDGSFGASLLIDTNGMVHQLVVGDCDGDGDADILVHHSNTGTDYLGTLVWWSYQAGAFVPSAPLAVDAESPLNLCVLDLGGDGVADAVSGTFAGFDTLQLFRTVNGAPTLEATLPLPSELLDINQRLRVGDLDGDGDADILATLDDALDTHRFYLQPFLRTATGWLAKPLQSAENSVIEPLLSREGVLADWDEDGDLDYVSPSLSWLENVGGASFALAGHVYAPLTGNPDTQLVIDDLDGDGHLDAMVEWLRVMGDGELPRTASVPEWDDASSYVWTQVEDWEHDGDLDLVSASVLQLNDGRGNFGLRFTPLPSTGEYLSSVGWGDFDGDGFRDLVASAAVAQPFPLPPLFVGMRLFAGDEGGAYALSSVVPSSIEMQADGGPSGDLDGDGDEDILARDGYWSNDGAAHFGTAPVAAYAGLPLQALDVDGDHDLDLLVHRGSALELLVNQGGAAFQTVSLGAFGTTPFASFLDADEDGDLDFVLTRSGQDLITIRAQLAGGAFAPPLTLATPGTNGPVGQLDVDGDGRLDLVVGRRAPNAYDTQQVLAAWLRGPGLAFVERREWSVREAPLVCADFDGDGDREALGRFRLENFVFDGPEAGSAQQYALDGATLGTGGVHPVLGASGPLRPGAEAALRIARGLGGAPGTLLVGTGRTELTLGGVQVFVAPQTVARAFVLDGPAGVAGAGEAALHLPLGAAMLGRTLTFQVLLVDPGASAGLSATNGLEVHFGSVRPAVER